VILLEGLLATAGIRKSILLVMRAGGKPKGGNVRSLCLHRKLFSKNFKSIEDLSDTRARLQRHWLVLILSFIKHHL